MHTPKILFQFVDYKNNTRKDETDILSRTNKSLFYKSHTAIFLYNYCFGQAAIGI